MPFDTNLLEVMNSTVVWEAITGVDSFGNPTYGNAQNIAASYFHDETRGEDTPQQGIEGPQYYRTYTIYVPYNGVKPRDRITLPDGTVTYVDTESTYNDPLVGDQAVQELQTKEIR